MEFKGGLKFLFCRASYRKTASHFSGRTIALPALPKAHAQFIAHGHEPQLPPPSHAGAFALLPPLAGSAMSESCASDPCFRRMGRRVRYRRSGPASRTGGRTDCNRSRRSAWLCPRWLEIRDRNALENRRAQEAHWQILGGKAYAKLALCQYPVDRFGGRPTHPNPLPKGRGSLAAAVEKAFPLPSGRGTG